jgi:hypothetical protein
MWSGCSYSLLSIGGVAIKKINMVKDLEETFLTIFEPIKEPRAKMGLTILKVHNSFHRYIDSLELILTNLGNVELVEREKALVDKYVDDAREEMNLYVGDVASKRLILKRALQFSNNYPLQIEKKKKIEKFNTQDSVVDFDRWIDGFINNVYHDE